MECSTDDTAMAIFLSPVLECSLRTWGNTGSSQEVRVVFIKRLVSVFSVVSVLRRMTH